MSFPATTYALSSSSVVILSQRGILLLLAYPSLARLVGMAVVAMELGARVSRVTRNLGLCPSALFTPGAQAGLWWNSGTAQSLASSGTRKLSSQGSCAPRGRPTIVAAKQPQGRAKKSRAPSSAGELDVKKAVRTPPPTPSDQPAAAESARPSQDADEAASKQGVDDTALSIASRDAVLKACVSTSGGLAAAGVVIRQASHWAAAGGWAVPDCAALMPYGFEVWHLGATAGTVVLIASLRQLLLSVWPEFSQSSRTSNLQVLSSLEPLDYLVVSFLPGISEELLFRGALLPLVGIDWRGAAVAGLVFGVLHVTGGRNAAFAAWASFVGVVYGVAAVSTSNLGVPMAAHSVANLVAASLWRLHENGNTKKTS